MKKLLITIISLLFITCTTDDSSSEVYSGIVTKSDIEGEWTVTEFFTKNGKVKTKVEGVNVTAKFESFGKNFNNAKANFNQNPNKAVSTGTFTNVTTVSYLTFSQTEESKESVKLNGDWSINNNNITLTSNGITTKYSIIETFAKGSLKNLKISYL